jgi:hypothetical protein
MPLGEKKVRWLTGFLLTAGILLSRLPFISKMLYEFDSIDFAVATFRYSLEQVTPHFPGYILHIFFAKALLLFFTDANLAFVWISILLSIGSVLFLWRAAASLRGERVGVIAAVLLLITPIFWFYGEVATAYLYEAFFASIFLYLGIRLLKEPQKKWLLYFLFMTLSLATGARQSSIIFFAPCLIYLIWKTRQPLKTWVMGLFLFLIVTISWLLILFSYSGGIHEYFAQEEMQTVYRSQSIIFGNSLHSHLAVIAKVLLYLFIASLPFIIVFVISLIRYFNRTINFIKNHFSKPTSYFTILVALPALLFYIGIYFMKAGYLLNILPSITIATAVLLDQMTIWRAEKIKRASHNKLLLTRPVITFGAIGNVLMVVVFDLIIFLTPFPWTCSDYFNDAFTRDSFNAGITLPKDSGNRGVILNKFSSFTNLSGIKKIDLLHREVLDSLKKENPESLVLLDTWWHRWGYYYLPEATIYDVRDFELNDSLWIGRSQNYTRKVVEERTIHIPSDKKVLLLLREDHPSFANIASQVHLQRIDLPQYLDIYRVTDNHFSFKWKNVLFIKE